VLSQEADLDVVAQLDRVDDALTTVAREKPQVIVLDPLLSGKIGIEELCDRLPQGKVLLLIDRESVATKRQALLRLAPRVGSIATDASPADLADAVRHLADGKPVLDVELAVAALQAEDNPLTGRETEVLQLVRTGATAQEVARRLSLSAGTVRNHLSPHPHQDRRQEPHRGDQEAQDAAGSELRPGCASARPARGTGRTRGAGSHGCRSWRAGRRGPGRGGPAGPS
jgi:two-component system response regulator DesR